MAESIRCTECGARLKAENETAHMRKVHPNVPFEPRGHPASSTRPSFYMTSKTRKAVFALVVAVVIVSAGVLLTRNLGKDTPVDPGATSVRVSMSGFEPNTLDARVGQTLKVDLINMDNQYHPDGGGWHDFVVEAFGMNRSVEPMGQVVFTVPTGTAGTYTWYCDICCGGKDNPSMIGTIRVTA